MSGPLVAGLFFYLSIYLSILTVGGRPEPEGFGRGSKTAPLCQIVCYLKEKKPRPGGQNRNPGPFGHPRHPGSTILILFRNRPLSSVQEQTPRDPSKGRIVNGLKKNLLSSGAMPSSQRGLYSYLFVFETAPRRSDTLKSGGPPPVIPEAIFLFFFGTAPPLFHSGASTYLSRYLSIYLSIYVGIYQRGQEKPPVQRGRCPQADI